MLILLLWLIEPISPVPLPEPKLSPYETPVACIWVPVEVNVGPFREIILVCT